ncbi:hypothetical protein QUC31_008366 [Theobroma cacao]
MLDESCVFGRDSDKEKTMKLPKSVLGTGDKVHVIPIVGLEGIGKTTLARIVYGEKMMKDRFDLKAWACAADEFDAKRITRTLVESITRKNCKEFGFTSREADKFVKGKEFLVVLDDVWNEGYENWDELKILFAKGAAGTTIMVTTRSEKVASIVGTLPIHCLEELSKEDCMSLFEQIVFPNGNSDAEKRVSKCRGLPLAVKALGGLLRS